MSDFETLSSGAVGYRPWRKSNDTDNDYVVRPSGTPATDNANVAAAVAALNSAGEGTLRLESGVELTGLHTFTAPINLRGMQPNTVVKTTADFAFDWDPGSIPDAPSASHHDITATAGDEYFTTTAYTPAAGDMTMLYSNDAISGVYPHTVIGNNYPGSIHTVVRWDSGTNRAYLDGRIPYTLATSAKAFVIPTVLNNVVVSDLSFEYSGSSQGIYAFAFRFKGCRNATAENIHMPQSGAGGIRVRNSQDCHLRGIVMENCYDDDSVYGIQAAFANGLFVSDFMLGGMRHTLDTGTAFSTGNDRYGCPQNIMFHNGLVRGFTELDGSSRVSAKTHSEGYGVTFDTVVFDIGSEAASVNHGVVAIAPNTQFRNCTFRGQFVAGTGTGGIGVSLKGVDCVVQNCLFEKLYQPILVTYVTDANDTYASGCIIKGNTIRDAYHPAISLRSAATGIIIEHNTFENVGNTSEKSVIDIQGGSGHRIHFNDMTKGNNDYSVDLNTLAATDIEMAGNVCYGYGSSTVGFDGTNASAAETAHAGDNYTD
jgi:parallel beta-helix repeat protein